RGALTLQPRKIGCGARHDKSLSYAVSSQMAGEYPEDIMAVPLRHKPFRTWFSFSDIGPRQGRPRARKATARKVCGPLPMPIPNRERLIFLFGLLLRRGQPFQALEEFLFGHAFGGHLGVVGIDGRARSA